MVKAHFPEFEFSAYLFDFDGTIVDTMGPHLVAWNRALSSHGLRLSSHQHQTWAGRPTREIVRLLNELHGTRMDPDQVATDKEGLYLDSLHQIQTIVPVMSVIQNQRGRIPMAIVTGSRRRTVEATLRHLKLESFFDVLVCAEDYVHGKPAPDCFLKAAELLEVPAEKCLVFEDAELGIQAAFSAGMPCLRVLPRAGGLHELERVEGSSGLSSPSVSRKK